MAASENIFVYVPTLLTAFLVVSEVAKKKMDRRETVPFGSMLKSYFEQGVSQRHQYAAMRSDSEIYLGFWFAIGLLLGISSFLTLIFYFQIMRVKYMVNIETKQAFTRVD